MVTIAWDISRLDRQTLDGFVTAAYWQANATDGEFSASVYGTVGFEAGTPTTPYASLTKAQVIQWVKDKLGEETVEASLAAQIAAQKNPTTATGMPW